LRTLAALAAVQGVAMIGYVGVDVVVSATEEQANWGAVAFTVTVLGLWGVGLLLCARGLLGLRRWAFTPIVFTQLVFGAIALSVLGSASVGARVAWVVILVLAVVTLVLAFSRPVRDAVTSPR
jgi:hypothetical protein